MHLKSLFIGVLIGAALATGALLTFGDQILGGVADTTKQVGKSVEKAGKAIEKQGDQLN